MIPLEFLQILMSILQLMHCSFFFLSCEDELMCTNVVHRSRKRSLHAAGDGPRCRSSGHRL